MALTVRCVELETSRYEKSVGVKANRTHLQVLPSPSGGGGPHAILRPRQKRHARGGFLSESFPLFRLVGRLPEASRDGTGSGEIW